MRPRTERSAERPAAERAGLDAVALKPSEHDLSLASELSVDTVAVDFEGVEHLPDRDRLAALAGDVDLRVTTPVRADGFDPLGDDGLFERLPEACGYVIVAGHPAYLTEAERARDLAPRIGAAVERADDPWIGTERMERLALAAGGTQYALLDGTTERTVETLRRAGLEEHVAVYAPTVLSDDEDAVLDAVGAYVARREPVRAALPEDAPTDARATGRAREVLRNAVEDYALAGSVDAVDERVEELRAAGVTTVVGYPARGVDDLL